MKCQHTLIHTAASNRPITHNVSFDWCVSIYICICVCVSVCACERMGEMLLCAELQTSGRSGKTHMFSVNNSHVRSASIARNTIQFWLKNAAFQFLSSSKITFNYYLFYSYQITFSPIITVVDASSHFYTQFHENIHRFSIIVQAAGMPDDAKFKVNKLFQYIQMYITIFSFLARWREQCV